MKDGSGKDWAIVLAAGDGTRLRSLTEDPAGRVIPKQFCSLHGGQSLLQEAIARAQRVVAQERIVVIVAEAHESWWQRDLTGFSRERCIVQPANKGTAAGVLLPLLNILGEDRDANILLVPSDHHVEREAVLTATMRQALAYTKRQREQVVLLGVTPDCADIDYGWIVPESGEHQPHAVEAFVEKPHPTVVGSLRTRGALWNSFLLAANGKALLNLYHEHLPVLLKDFIATDLGSHESLNLLYGSLASRDFSRDLLQCRPDVLRMLRVPSCGWTDLGTPERVAACIARQREHGRSQRRSSSSAWDLSLALARYAPAKSPAVAS